MKHLIGLSFLAVALLAAPSRAADKPASDKAAKPRLAILVVDTLHSPRSSFYEYDLIAEEFSRVFEGRNWPVNVTVERFAANNEASDLEIRLFYRGIADEFGERVYRAWTVFYDHGTKHDFGVVTYRYQPRPAERVDDVIHRVFRGAAEATAALVQPYIVPASNPPKS